MKSHFLTLTLTLTLNPILPMSLGVTLIAWEVWEDTDDSKLYAVVRLQPEP